MISNDGYIKLGDFGEACVKQRLEDTTKANRMGILGTVSFMAPELIAASIHYTEGVDIYAYAVMMWEIWSGGKDPFGDITTFKTYEVVGNGERPDCTFFNTEISTEMIQQCVNHCDTTTGTVMNSKLNQPKRGLLGMFSSSNSTTTVDVVNPITSAGSKSKSDSKSQSQSYLIPKGALDIIQASWHQDATKRLSAKEMVNSLCDLYHQLLLDAGAGAGMESAIQEFIDEREYYETQEEFGIGLEDESSLRNTFSSIKEMFTTSPMQEV